MQSTECHQKYLEKSHHLACRNCLFYTLPISTPPKFCIECQSVLACPKSINYCGTCLYESKLFTLRDCNLCMSKHLFRWSYCEKCTQFIERNDSDPNYYSIFCSNHANYCLHCKTEVREGIICGLGHQYHVNCFYKYPKTIKHCNSCTEITSSQIVSLISNTNGEFCFLCKTFQADSIVTCMLKYFFCAYCLVSHQFTQVNIDCFCDRCEKYKVIQRRFIENYGKCSKCNIVNAMKYKSVCGKATLCEKCLENNYLKVYICGCPQCNDTEKSHIISCSLCEETDLVRDKGQCAYQNYYCEKCLNTQLVAKKISGICNCEFCVNICMKESDIIQEVYRCKSCSQTNTRILNRSGCINRIHYCRNCIITQKTPFLSCSCNYCSQFQNYPPKYSIPVCQNHPKRQKQITLACGHNFCYGCLCSENFLLFVSFFNFYATNHPETLQTLFQFKCPNKTCNTTMNLSAGFLIEKLNILIRYAKDKIELFAPYFEGLSLNFYTCKCRQIVGSNNDVVIGCFCPQNEAS